ncbi:MAG: hypothetical protein LBB55_05230, partial [Zoogloeaceae bacterium]|nr:hypothetical protein [Zoogloeaceae bacterium]
HGLEAGELQDFQLFAGKRFVVDVEDHDGSGELAVGDWKDAYSNSLLKSPACLREMRVQSEVEEKSCRNDGASVS